MDDFDFEEAIKVKITSINNYFAFTNLYIWINFRQRKV